jgi:cellulose biosynthesis protein BcsQ
MPVSSVAFVGVVGGAGTTRTVLELAGVLARAGRSALVLDLDFATQGLERFVEGRIEPDATTLLADQTVDLSAAVHEVEVDGSGRLGLVPAYAPFARIADAKSPDAGAAVDEHLETAAEAVDHVLLDVPPIVSNQAIGAVTAAESVVATIAPTDRGVDALQREKGRIEDVDASLDQVLAVGSRPASAPPDADLALPSLPGGAPDERAVTLDSSGAFTAQAVTVAETLFAVDLEASIEASASVLDRAKRQLGR